MRNILGIFDNRDSLMAALKQTRTDGFRPAEVFSPVLDQELIAAITPKKSPVYRLTLLGGIAGASSGLALTIWTTAQWPLLNTGGKPIISIPPFLVIVFTLTILLGSLGTLAGFLYWSILSRARHPLPYDPRFSDAHFGLCVQCQDKDAEKVINLLRQKGAIECRQS